ncbi:hypothetical protein PFICI_09441 [Pestalotiopsis fici W106-1]|uniref:Uncharacterized protein n=1 Tax=Pestalotiopsis fici (strain W106-1 / CGMCC3.15140) TaxID=1229662 RepID=W3X0C2_PESFW|nr:uncharacterized protein PFICI_09441 [Pestalotiopsis fici W106-1]ETS79588.1 hypothetical protein PFICI_09441 [Pestalotiopsis fici W106-1]
MRQTQAETENMSIADWRLDELRHQMDDLVSKIIEETQGFVALFTPLTFPHTLLDRIWGALAVIYKFKNLVPWKASGDSSRNSGKPTVSWIVRRPVSWSEAEKRGIPLPSTGFRIDDCAKCYHQTQYESVGEAVQHVRQVHYKQSGLKMDGEVLTEKLRFWVHTSEQRVRELSNLECVELLQAYHHCIERAYEQGLEIRDVVAHCKEEGNPLSRATERPKTLQLPSKIVRAFENFVVITLCTAHALTLLENRPPKDSDTKELSEVPPLRRVIDLIANRSLMTMEKAHNEISLFLKTDLSSSGVSFAAVGPRFILSVIFDGLSQRRFFDKTAVAVYEDTASSVQYKAYNGRPTRRLLTTIERFQEELEAIALLAGKINQTWTNFIMLGDEKTYRISDQTRRQHQQMEHKVYSSAWFPRQRETNKIYAIQMRLTKMENKLRQRIEIQDEDQGKAIMIFTIVTIIFLPLSFVTSFLGMNTADIRDMENSQTLFWIIAMPVSALVLSVTGILAWKGDTIRDWLSNQILQRSRVTLEKNHDHLEPRKVASGRKPKQKQGKQWLRRRRQVSFKEDDLEMN